MRGTVSDPPEKSHATTTINLHDSIVRWGGGGRDKRVAVH